MICQPVTAVTPSPQNALPVKAEVVAAAIKAKSAQPHALVPMVVNGGVRVTANTFSSPDLSGLFYFENNCQTI